MNLTELERSQFESILHRRCEAIADHWYKAVVRTSFVPHDSEVTIQQFTKWTEQVIELLLTEPFDHDRMQAIGALLAQPDRVQPEALGKTQQVLAHRIVEGLSADQVVALQPRIAMLLGDLATGFARQAYEILSDKQKKIRSALVTELEQAEEELERYRGRLKKLVSERTAELMSAIAHLDEEITTRERMSDALRRRNRELALLNRASHTLTSTFDLDQVLAIVLEEVRRLLGIVACSIWLLEHKTGELVCLQATGPQSEIVRGFRLATGDGIVGWAVANGESLIVPDIRTDERHFKGVDKQTGLDLRSILTVPLQVKDNAVGAIQVTDTTVNRFSPTDLVLLEPLAASAAIAIDNARLVEALRQRTAELDAFAADVAHDLGNPLTLIMGTAEVLVEGYDLLPEESLRDSLLMIARNGRRMKDIIDALLLLARVGEDDVILESLNMAHIVVEAQQRLPHLIEKYQAEISVPETWPIVLGHSQWVEEIWDNYLSNALKYGGHPPCVELGSTVEPDGMVSLWVRDNGSGLSPEDQAQLFTPFKRLSKKRTDGHGLGLAIVQRIVEKLGGRVWVKSEVGQGSTFGFTLPAAPVIAEEKKL
ncbi:MAG: GAF domain-containing sensor histidine kinase [Chloroflexi bacterium]|nr:GAF domain-containing sensor histidine kinase [Chloroflexota bacterium]